MAVITTCYLSSVLAILLRLKTWSPTIGPPSTANFRLTVGGGAVVPYRRSPDAMSHMIFQILVAQSSTNITLNTG